MNKSSKSGPIRIWLKVFLIVVLMAVSILNVYLNRQPRQAVSTLDLSTLHALSEYDDY